MLMADYTPPFTIDYRILSKTTSDDNMGNKVPTWSPVENSSYKGHHRVIKAIERTVDNRESFSSSHKHWYPANVTLNETLRIEVMSGDDLGKVFDVIPLKNVWGHHKTAELSLVI